MSKRSRPETIPGYVHPETTNVTYGNNKASVYATFNPDKKKQTGKVDTRDTYAKMDVETDLSNMSSTDIENQRKSIDNGNPLGHGNAHMPTEVNRRY